MNDFATYIKDLILHGNQDPALIRSVKSEIMEENRRLLRLYSIIAAAAFLGLTALSFFDATIVDSRIVYIVGSIFALAFLITSLVPSSSLKKATPFLVIAAAFLIMVFGIALGTTNSDDTPTITFNILLFATPLLFTLLPWQSIAITLTSIVLYLITAHFTQTPEMFEFNLLNLVIFGIVSVIVGAYMAKIKLERFVALRENKRLSERDQLTGLFNRRCYDEHLARIEARPDKSDVKLCMADVNGLKKANDTLGHIAGDALIRGAGQCLEASFGKYGEVYRIGGDEYAVVMDNPSPDPDELAALLKAHVSQWHDFPGLTLSVSFGVACGDEATSSKELVALADTRMYADKDRHYRESGEDRRKARA